MSGILTFHSGHQAFGAAFQSAAAALGVTPSQLFAGPPAAPPVDMLVPVTLVQNVTRQGGNQFAVDLLGGGTFRLTLENNIVSQTSLEAGGQMLFSWQGRLNLEHFLSGDWLPDVVNGSAAADWLTSGYGRRMNGGGGNDFFEVFLEPAFGVLLPSVTAAGGAGVDSFMVSGSRGHLTLTDFQQGEKIIFSDYSNLNDLAADFRGIRETTNGFVANFSSFGSAWSLTFENFSLAQLRMEDLLFTDDVAQVTNIVAPILGSRGLTMADFMG